jgi:microcystin-dependent protein
MSEPYLGQIILFGGNFAIRGYAQCDGQLLPISQNTALFSILGTTYGGDGRTTFALPDLRGRIALHYGQGAGLPNYRLGERSGVTSVTLNTTNLPNHSHSFAVPASNQPADQDSPESTYPASLETDGYHAGPADTALGAGTTSNAGGQQSFSVQNPYLAVNYLIALQGIFPSRN